MRHLYKLIIVLLFSVSCYAESYPESDLVSRVCVDSAPRTIDGFKVEGVCWEYAEEYSYISYVTTEDAYCKELREQGCGFVGTSCASTDPVSGVCLKEEQKYQCSSENPARTVELCSEQLSCPDGECTEEYKTSKDATDDFLYAATSMATAGEIVENINFDELNIFMGKGLSCDDKSFSFADCCADGGWGTNLGLYDCSADEIELGIAREAESTHYVGSYGAGSWPFKYTVHVFCKYESKLSRIFVEQGNIQLNRTFGSAGAPRCEGFTVDELQSLDVDLMDLSEFFTDAMAAAEAGVIDDPNAIIVNSDKLIQDLKDKLEGMQ